MRKLKTVKPPKSALARVREWLIEKQERDVKQVRITSALTALADAEQEELAELAAQPLKRANGKVLIEPGDLISSSEAAKLLGVDATRPSKWRIKGTTFGPDKLPFPEPFAVFGERRIDEQGREKGAFPVFLRAEVEKLIPFVEERRRPTTRGDRPGGAR